MAKSTKSQEVDVAENGRPALTGEDPAQLRDYYYNMLLLRRFEERAGEMYTKAKIGGYCHLNLGEEATIVGLMAALTPDDYIFTNYREHGYIIARGIEPGPVMAELFGKETGVSRGRGGSMHLFDAKAHFMGGYAIVGGQVPLATGAAYALRYQERPGVVLCQVGDATTNIGAWYESLNLAALWDLPVLFFIVNNGFGMGTTVAEGSSEPDLWKKGSAFRIHGEQVDGTDVIEVRDTVKRLRERAEKEHKPAILDVTSFRFRGHSVIDPDRYRDQDEVKRERARQDPIPTVRQAAHRRPHRRRGLAEGDRRPGSSRRSRRRSTSPRRAPTRRSKTYLTLCTPRPCRTHPAAPRRSRWPSRWGAR